MATHPKDEFDDLPSDLARVGAHRGPRARGGGWIAFAWAALATAVIVIGALYYLSRIDSGFHIDLPFAQTATETPKPTITPTPTITAVTDPTTLTIKKRHITVTVLNGTAFEGLQTKAGIAIKKAKWKVVATATSSSTSIKKTTVYYGDAADKDVALGVAKVLGFDKVVFSSVYVGSKLTVVVGADYSGK
jgi:hypothetical protein